MTIRCSLQLWVQLVVQFLGVLVMVAPWVGSTVSGAMAPRLHPFQITMGPDVFDLLLSLIDPHSHL